MLLNEMLDGKIRCLSRFKRGSDRRGAVVRHLVVSWC